MSLVALRTATSSSESASGAIAKDVEDADFSKEWSCFRHLRIGHKVISAGFFPQVPIFLDLLLVYSSFWDQTWKSVFNFKACYNCSTFN